MKNRKRKNTIMVLLILVLGITIGFAALATTLKINGTANITKNTWNIYWDNPVVTTGSVTTTAPTLSAESGQTTNTIATWTTSLNLPGDFYEFTIDAVNAGTLDAMITDIENTVTPNLPSYIKYEVTYYDGETIAKKHLLSKKSGNTPTTEKYKVRVEFLDTITTEELNSIPEGGISYTFKYQVTYSQADDTAVPRPKDYLKIMTQTNGDTEPAFDNSEGITKAQVEKIYTLNTLEMPSDLQSSIIKSWDVSDKEDGSIMAYALDTDLNSKYEIYLAQNGGVKANPDSTKIFNYYTNVTQIDVSNLITNDVENMTAAFQRCLKLTDVIGEENWNTSKLTNMSGMFNYCSSLTSIDVSHFDTSNVNNMTAIFQHCENLVDIIGEENWNTDKVTIMQNMFNYCSSLTSIDLSHFNTSKVTNMSLMFNNCSSLTSIDLSHFVMNGVNNTNGMFQKCSSLQNLVMPNDYTRIDSFMFNHVSSYPGESFTIPKNVTSFGNSHLFYNFGKDEIFKRFIVEDGNTAAKVVDDILYSYDGTRLIAIPRAKTFTNNTYEMPEGIIFLTELSFSRNQNIDTVVLPNSYEIERYIDADDNSYDFINSGNSLSVGIYRYTSVKNYEVKADNPRYISYEGCIYSKDGTELIAVPLHYTGVLNVKSGTTTFGQEALWDFENVINDSLTTINIPASVTTIEPNQLATLNKLITKGVVINIDSSNTVYEIVNNQIVAR